MALKGVMIMSLTEERRESQLQFINTNSELEVGSLDEFPLEVDELQEIDKASQYVVKVFDSGLTAVVYKLCINGELYNLKKKRNTILVKNVDGQTSFLNEVQRRNDFYYLKNKDSKSFTGIVDTIYASFQKGIILSPWIDGVHITKGSKKIYESLFNTLLDMELNGIFEWDLCGGNLLVSKGDIKLFDFGYTYRFNPLTQFNSDGMDSPLFHMAERFETRFFMQYLMDIELSLGKQGSLKEYKEEKEAALKIYNKKLEYLKKNKALKEITDWLEAIILSWEEGLKSDKNLEELYGIEAFRSYILDIGDDVGGKSCTVSTIKKIDRVLELIEHDYDFLINKNILFFGDEKLNRQQLIEKYKEIRKLVIKYQL